MKTGDYSFTDATGVEWWVVGSSRVCGDSYVDCWSADGKALTVRPKAYLAPSELYVPTQPDILPGALHERWQKYNSGQLSLRVVESDNIPEGMFAVVDNGEVLAYAFTDHV